MTGAGRRGGLVTLGSLPREAAGTLVAVARSWTADADHSDGCDMSGDSETCTVCAINRWASEVNVRG